MALLRVMFQHFNERSHKLERLDTGDYTPEEYARWQREMKFIHGMFGELRALRLSLEGELQDSREKEISILDVGAGSGELLRSVGRWIKNMKTFLVGVELNEEAAKSIKRGSDKDEILSVQCNALKLPFSDDSFDYTICSLFLHHLDNEQSVALISEMSRVAKKKIFVIDLHRHPVAYYFYKTFSSIFLQRFTHEDGSLSILKSFRPAELMEVARRANLENIEVKRRAAYRLVLSGRKKANHS